MDDVLVPDVTTGEPTSMMVEVSPGLGMLVGDGPEGIDLVGFDMVAALQPEILPIVLECAGDAATIYGNVAEAASRVRGLYRLTEQSWSIVRSGGSLAVKDGANLGSILQNGKIVAQARFIPLAATGAAMAAAIGPAVAMIGLQMALGQVSGLARTNVGITKRVLEELRRADWGDLEGRVNTIDRAVNDARKIGCVNQSIWDSVSHLEHSIESDNKRYAKDVLGHVTELSRLKGKELRQYLELNAQAIFFDLYASVAALRMRVGYESLKAEMARSRGIHDPSETHLSGLILEELRRSLPASVEHIRMLTRSLFRELNIIAALPGRKAMPLPVRRGDSKVVKQTSGQLLEALEPLTAALCPAIARMEGPATTCAPDDLNLEDYLNIVRWYLADDEGLRAVAFGVGSIRDDPRAISAEDVNAAWDRLSSGWLKATVLRTTSSTFIAVTNRRIITADAKQFVVNGLLEREWPLSEVQYVRPRANYKDTKSPTIGVFTHDSDLQWMFPQSADVTQIDAFTDAIMAGESELSVVRPALVAAIAPDVSA